MSDPSSDANVETELLFGEAFIVYELKNGWVWGQAALDSHVGYASAEAFGEVAGPPTHRVNARATPLLGYEGPFAEFVGANPIYDARAFLFGGGEIGPHTLLRFYILHCIFIPLVASVLMAMGMMMLSPVIISLPFKLMLFVLVDGWALIIGSLAASYG